MKKIIYILTIALLAVVTGCEKEIGDRVPSPEGGVGPYFFNTEEAVELNPADNIKSYDVRVGRVNKKGAATFNIIVDAENTDEVFQVPATISFEDGVAETKLTVAFPDAEIGGTYNLQCSIEVSEEQQSPYGAGTTLSLSVSQVQWSEEHIGIIEDGIFGPFGVPNSPFYAKWKSTTFPNGLKRIRFIEPYRSYMTGVDEDGIADGFIMFDDNSAYSDIPGEYPLDITIKTDGKVVIGAQHLGVNVNSSYGILGVWTSAYGAFDDETDSVIVFNASALVLADENLDGLAYASKTSFWLSKEKYLKANISNTTITLTPSRGLPTGYTRVAVLFADNEGSYNFRNPDLLQEMTLDATTGDYILENVKGLVPEQQFRFLIAKEPAVDQKPEWSFDACEWKMTSDEYDTHTVGEAYSPVINTDITSWMVPTDFTLTTTTLPEGFTRVGVALLNPQTDGVTDVYEMEPTANANEYTTSIPHLLLENTLYTYVIAPEPKAGAPVDWEGTFGYRYPDDGTGSWFYTGVRAYTNVCTYTATSWLVEKEVNASITVTGGLPTGYVSLGVHILTDDGRDIIGTIPFEQDETNPELFTGKLLGRNGQPYLLAIAKEGKKFSTQEVELDPTDPDNSLYRFLDVSGDVTITTATANFNTLPDDPPAGVAPKRLDISPIKRHLEFQ